MIKREITLKGLPTEISSINLFALGGLAVHNHGEVELHLLGEDDFGRLNDQAIPFSRPARKGAIIIKSVQYGVDCVLVRTEGGCSSEAIKVVSELIARMKEQKMTEAFFPSLSSGADTAIFIGSAKLDLTQLPDKVADATLVGLRTFFFTKAAPNKLRRIPLAAMRMKRDWLYQAEEVVSFNQPIQGFGRFSKNRLIVNLSNRAVQYDFKTGDIEPVSITAQNQSYMGNFKLLAHGDLKLCLSVISGKGLYFSRTAHP